MAMLPLSLPAQAFLVARALLLPSGAKLRPNLRGYWQGAAAAVGQAPTMLRKRRDVQRRRRITTRELAELIRISERQRFAVVGLAGRDHSTL